MGAFALASWIPTHVSELTRWAGTSLGTHTTSLTVGDATTSITDARQPTVDTKSSSDPSTPTEKDIAQVETRRASFAQVQAPAQKVA